MAHRIARCAKRQLDTEPKSRIIHYRSHEGLTGATCVASRPALSLSYSRANYTTLPLGRLVSGKFGRYPRCKQAGQQILCLICAASETFYASSQPHGRGKWGAETDGSQEYPEDWNSLITEVPASTGSRHCWSSVLSDPRQLASPSASYPSIA